MTPFIVCADYQDSLYLAVRKGDSNPHMYDFRSYDLATLSILERNIAEESLFGSGMLIGVKYSQFLFRGIFFGVKTLRFA